MWTRGGRGGRARGREGEGYVLEGRGLVYEILGFVRRAMRVDDWNREWMMDGQVLLRFLPWQRGICGYLFLPPSFRSIFPI